MNGKADDSSKAEVVRPIKIEASTKKEKSTPEVRYVRMKLRTSRFCLTFARVTR